jgi:aminoglycoside phosphotransferase (APT) family kinase protein
MIRSEHSYATQLKSTIQTTYPAWQITDLALIGSGLEFLAFRADTALYGQVVIRTPRERWISNDNDLHIDARDLLIQEALLMQHFIRYNIPVPPFCAIHLDDTIDFLVSGFVNSDHTTPDSYQFGQLIRAIHSVPIPDFQPVMLFGQSLTSTLAERIVRRMAVTAQLGNVSLPRFQPSHLAAQLQCVDDSTCVIHMDARPGNLLTKNNQIVAILDWSNTLVGHPALDLARIAEYGHVNSDFIAGYEANGPRLQVPPVVDLIYRLDTAVVLAVVFLSEAPNEDLALPQVQRVVQLSALLADVL